MEVQFWTLIPFIIMLLMIAVAPLVAPKAWESNRNKLILTLILAIPTAIYLICAGMGHNLAHQVFGDYIPFIILLMSLYVITGGIRIKGDIMATPMVNSTILLIGFMLASVMGTTGAAMLLIRPILDINQQRTRKVHTILFFIALVANCGGVLSPLGDPPLFLLYLRGAPFEWFLGLFPQWILVGFILLSIYYVWDTIEFRREPISAKKRDMTELSPIRIKGRMNFGWLTGVVLSVVFLNEHYIPAMGDEESFFLVRYLREIILAALALGSWFTTNPSVRKSNGFSWSPILEVAILFVGIFVTMTPALMFLNQNAEALGFDKPWQFFYATGILSSFLDNSPTAVAFHSVATGLNLDVAEGAKMVAGIPETLLSAISLGAVFFGSMTYIGNGPNFMVKAIAEEKGIDMPSFFGYILKFSVIVLLPVYIIVQLIFL